MGSRCGHRIRELEEKMRGMEHKFEADKVLMERDFHTTQLKQPTLLSRGVTKP